MSLLEENIANIANLIGDKTRSRILVDLVAGKALTAGELALRATISAQTASNHLKKLDEAGLLICEAVGRHRYYKLASTDVAAAIEALSLLGDSPKHSRPPRHEKLDKEICFARSCYDHLAGTLAIELKNSLITSGCIEYVENRFRVTNKGLVFFKRMDIDVNALMKKKRPLARACLDWTERQHHIAGSLGSELLSYLLDQRLIIRAKSKPRVVILTEKGRQWMRQLAKI
ncbi:MAG: ArsR/SmtB family transcription factor [Francisellaceae bacterium]